MVIPVDATVLEGGLFASPNSIDFGVLQSGGTRSSGSSSSNSGSGSSSGSGSDDDKPQSLFVYNSGSSAVQVTDIVTTSDDHLIHIEYDAVVIPPLQEMRVARVAYHKARHNSKQPRPGKCSVFVV